MTQNISPIPYQNIATSPNLARKSRFNKYFNSLCPYFCIQSQKPWQNIGEYLTSTPGFAKKKSHFAAKSPPGGQFCGVEKLASILLNNGYKVGRHKNASPHFHQLEEKTWQR